MYVSDKPELDYAGLSTQTKCGLVTRKNTALFNPRLHFDCPEPIKASALITSLKKLYFVFSISSSHRDAMVDRLRRAGMFM